VVGLNYALERVMVGDKLVQERRWDSSMGGVRKGVVVAVVMAWSFILVWVVAAIIFMIGHGLVL